MDTQGTMKKKKNKPDPVKLSSSEKMEQSKPPKDVWGLGLYLVRELGFEKDDDILGRWMAHHLAELMNEAENGETETSRTKARKEATETIIKLWKHRASLPGRAYPLAPYQDLLQVIEKLRPTRNPFFYFARINKSNKDQIAAALFDSLNRLVIALLLMKLPTKKRMLETDQVATQALDADEAQLHDELQQLVTFIGAEDDGRESEISGDREASTEVNLGGVALQLVDEIATLLNELRNELGEKGI